MPPPPAVGLCLAFVLIPSHYWVQAPGPPTQLCQRLPEEGVQICLNYCSAPKTGHICSIRFQRNKQTNKKISRKGTQFRNVSLLLMSLTSFTGLKILIMFKEAENLRPVAGSALIGSWSLLLIICSTSWRATRPSAEWRHWTLYGRCSHKQIVNVLAAPHLRAVTEASLSAQIWLYHSAAGLVTHARASALACQYAYRGDSVQECGNIALMHSGTDAIWLESSRSLIYFCVRNADIQRTKLSSKHTDERKNSPVAEARILSSLLSLKHW